ncbi:amidase [Paenalcaligenes niemegkensis]|uniref:amidase n=1 Tax=Paenalcaligenes niemegkensis TaxID=2895469 RepID=UPI001EE93F6D|nr:amidase [Paenalcaligenes niemegkensis]MCQ9617442.1 amidase [Paenalcaligenes niemegkensis]
MTSTCPTAEGGSLSGHSFAVKDNIDVEGWATGCGNPEWARRQGPAGQSAAVVTMLLNAGAVFRGKTLTDEFAWSATGNNPHYGAPANPLAPERFTGGSSCGSASVVAQGLVDLALGTDTGGSVRIPAAFTGLFGMRPTYGSIPINGVTPLAPSLDTVGFMAKTAQILRDTGSVLLPCGGIKKLPNLLIAEDAFNLTSARHRMVLEPWVASLSRYVCSVRTHLLVPAEGGLQPLASVFQVLQAAEIKESLLPKLSGMDSFLGEGLRKRIAYAGTITDADAGLARRTILDYMLRIVEHVGDDTVVVLPTTPDVAPLRTSPEDMLAAYRSKMIELSCIASITGMPQVTMPFAVVDGAPFGLSIMGPRGSDLALLELAWMLQQGTS